MGKTGEKTHEVVLHLSLSKGKTCTRNANVRFKLLCIRKLRPCRSSFRILALGLTQRYTLLVHLPTKNNQISLLVPNKYHHTYLSILTLIHP